MLFLEYFLEGINNFIFTVKLSIGCAKKPYMRKKYANFFHDSSTNPGPIFIRENLSTNCLSSKETAGSNAEVNLFHFYEVLFRKYFAFQEQLFANSFIMNSDF